MWKMKGFFFYKTKHIIQFYELSNRFMTIKSIDFFFKNNK